MDVKVYPSKVSGSVLIPASKSVIHRALIASALSNEKNEITNVDFNQDILATIKALKSLGAKITVSKNSILVNGFDVYKEINEVKINAFESGSTLRFLLPLATYKSKKVTFFGSDRLMERPLSVYKDIYTKQNLIFKENIDNKIIKGKLKAGVYSVSGDISSQFISGLLFLLPLLKADSIIEVIPPFESKSYVNLTIAVLKKYNIEIKNNKNKYLIKANQKYLPYNLHVEGDFSQAAFFMVLGAINNDLVIKNLNLQTLQGDRAIIEFLISLNVKIETTANQVKVYKSQLKSASLDLVDSPDLGPILCVLGLFTDNYLKLDNVRRLRLKESDRLLAMKTQLEKIGAKLDLTENSITIYKLEKFKDTEIIVDGCNDHRVVMAMAILATCLNKPLIIKGAAAVNKSYPNFFKDLNQLGIKTEYI